jgi:hypothetical protein
MAVAAEVGSPGQGGSSRALIRPLLPELGSQIAARKLSTCLSTQVLSCTAVSPQPTIWPSALTPVAKLWVPPKGASSRISPPCQTKPRQTRLVGLGLTMNPPSSQLQSSSSGSTASSWEIPTTMPASFQPLPGDGAAGAAEGVEVGDDAVPPERGVAGAVGQVGPAGDPLRVVDRHPPALGAAEVGGNLDHGIGRAGGELRGTAGTQGLVVAVAGREDRDEKQWDGGPHESLRVGKPRAAWRAWLLLP